MQEILQKDKKVLRKIAKEVNIDDILISKKIKKVLEEMKEALESQKDGVAIAAPQIGYSLRIFIVSSNIFARNNNNNLELKQKNEQLKNAEVTNKLPADFMPKISDGKNLIFINPIIIKFSNEKSWLDEGCLSVRPFYGKTFRSRSVKIVAYDENGKQFTKYARGLLAQIFQHEVDHLNGILFIDHGKDIREEIELI